MLMRKRAKKINRESKGHKALPGVPIRLQMVLLRSMT